MDPKKQPEGQPAKKATAKPAKDAGEAGELQAAAAQSAELEVAPPPPAQEQEAEGEVQQEAEPKVEPEAKEAAKAFKHDLLVSAEDDAVLNDLQEIWRPVIKQELEARHAMGMRIKVAYYSGDKKRAEHGEKVMLVAQLRLGINTSDLYRMRKFAERFPDFAAFRQKYPDIPWTEVREMVVDKPRAARKRNPWLARVDLVTEIFDLMEKEPGEVRKHVPLGALEVLKEKVDKVVVRLVILVGTPFVPSEVPAEKK